MHDNESTSYRSAGPLVSRDFEHQSSPPLQSDAPSVGATPATSRFQQNDIEALRHVIAQYDEELALLRASKQNDDLELIELRTLQRRTEERLHGFHSTVEFQLGRLLVQSFTSWRRFLVLPPRLSVFLWKTLRGSPHSDAKSSARQLAAERQAKAVADALAYLKSSDITRTSTWARTQKYEPKILARVLMELARTVRRTDLRATIALCKEAIALAPSEQRIKWLAFALADSGAVLEPAGILRDLVESGVTLTAAELKRADELFALSRLARDGLQIPAPVKASGGRQQRRCLIVTTRALPVHSTASAMRAHTTALALTEAGWDAEVVVLAGQGERSPPDKSSQPFYRLSDVNYRRIDIHADLQNINLYVAEAADSLAHYTVQSGASIIHVMSDLLPGYVGALAARKTGLPFIIDYAERAPDLPSHSVEMRASERAELLESWQFSIAATADAVIARSQSLYDLLVSKTITEARIIRLGDVAVYQGDGHDRSARVPQAIALTRSLTLGYIGEASENIDFGAMVNLLRELVAQGIDASLLLVGNGRRLDQASALARDNNLADRMVILPKPKLTLLPAHYALIDIFVVPYESPGRRAPYELVEAMAHGACILTTDYFDARAVVGNYAVFAGRSTFSQAAAELSADPDRRKALGLAAKARSEELFSRERIGGELARTYDRHCGHATDLPANVQILRPDQSAAAPPYQGR